MGVVGVPFDRSPDLGFRLSWVEVWVVEEEEEVGMKGWLGEK